MPAWLDASALDADQFHAPTLRAGAGPELRAAAEIYAASLGHLATHDERTAILANMRLQLMTREEHRDEARARFRLLRDAVADVPLEILQEGCAAYTRRSRFFPVAISELLAVINPIVSARRSAAWRLRRMADLADEQDARERELAADPLTPEAMAAIKAEFGLGGDPVEPGMPYVAPAPTSEPTLADYIELGLTEDDAQAALAERAKLLARQRPGKRTNADGEAILRDKAA